MNAEEMNKVLEDKRKREEEKNAVLEARRGRNLSGENDSIPNVNIKDKEYEKPNTQNYKLTVPKKKNVIDSIKGFSKRVISLFLVTGVAITGAVASLIKKGIDENQEIKATMQEVEGKSNNEIKRMILDELKIEVAKATGKNEEDIKLFVSDTGSFERYEVTAGDNKYIDNVDLRDPSNEPPGTLQSKDMNDILLRIRHAQTREDYVKALNEAREFAVKYDLEMVINGSERILKQVKVEKDKVENDNER